KSSRSRLISSTLRSLRSFTTPHPPTPLSHKGRGGNSRSGGHPHAPVLFPLSPGGRGGGGEGALLYHGLAITSTRVRRKGRMARSSSPSRSSQSDNSGTSRQASG